MGVPQVRFLQRYAKQKNGVKMPHYDFTCECGAAGTYKFDFNEEHKVQCPVCDKYMTKVFTPNPVHFKGTGWGKD
jgi:putative FmdB family regulatory protein